MEIALTQDLERLVRDEVESGRYGSPAEVIREALRIFRQPVVEESDTLRRQIQIGLRDLERGAYDDYDDESLPKLVEQVRQRGCRRLAAGTD